MVRGGAFKSENSNCKDPEAGELDVPQDGKEVAHTEETGSWEPEGAGRSEMEAVRWYCRGNGHA